MGSPRLQLSYHGLPHSLKYHGNWMWTFQPCTLILFSVKKIFVLLTLSLIILTSIAADTVFWNGEEKGNNAYSDKYAVSSVISLSLGEKTTTVKIAGPMGDTLPGRDLGLSKETLTDLGIWGQSDTVLDTAIVNGKVKEETAVTENSGWYSITLTPYDISIALEKYKTLIFYSFRPEAVRDEETIIYTIPYVAEYELEDTENLLKEVGLTIEKVEETTNPYIQE